MRVYLEGVEGLFFKAFVEGGFGLAEGAVCSEEQ